MRLNWYDLKAAGYGTITIKAMTEEEAKEEAAERWKCSEDEIICTGHKPYFGGCRLW